MNLTSIYTTVMENAGPSMMMYQWIGGGLGLGLAALYNHKAENKVFNNKLNNIPNDTSIAHIAVTRVAPPVAILFGSMVAGSATGYGIDQLFDNSFKAQQTRTTEACKGVSASGDALRIEQDKDGNVACIIRASTKPNVRAP